MSQRRKDIYDVYADNYKEGVSFSEGFNLFIILVSLSVISGGFFSQNWWLLGIGILFFIVAIRSMVKKYKRKRKQILDRRKQIAKHHRRR